MPRTFFVTSWGFLAATVLSVALFVSTYFGLTAFEIIVFALVFAWIATFIRFLGVTAQRIAPQTADAESPARRVTHRAFGILGSGLDGVLAGPTGLLHRRRRGECSRFAVSRTSGIRVIPTSGGHGIRPSGSSRCATRLRASRGGKGRQHQQRDTVDEIRPPITTIASGCEMNPPDL